MATPIDQLNFKVILNDTDFKTRINEDIALAGRLNTSLSKVIQIKTRQIVSSAGVKNAQQMSQYLTEISNKIRTMPKGNFLVGDADRLNATLAETNKRLDQIISKSQKAGQGMGVTGKNLTRTWIRFSSTLWSVIGAIRLVTSTFGAAIKNISNFQQANANLATIMQVSRKEIETLTNDALMLGRTTEWTASQVTELQTALAKLGYDIPQIRNMQASVLQFATAVGAKLPDAANLAGASLRMFGMHSTEMQKALEILAASTNKTALDFEKLKVSLPYVGAIAHSIGFDIAQTASLLGVLTNAGLESSRAGTGLRQVLLELSKTNGKLQTAMGGNVKSFDDFVNGLQAMRDRGLQAGEATKLVSTRASSALLILANGVDTIKKLNNEVRDTDGLLKDIQQERLDTLHGSTLLLKSAWEGLIQTFRDTAGPVKDLVLWFRDVINAMSLLSSRANRVAQGTKDVFGSDTLVQFFKQRYDQLIEGGSSPEVAAKVIQEAMDEKMREFRRKFGLKDGEEPNNVEDTWLYKNTGTIPLTRWIRNAITKKDRVASTQIDAMKSAEGAMHDYMESNAKENAEISAHAYLEQWKAIFDAEGEKAARSAMSKVGGSELIDKMKQQMEAYIANGGAAGAQERGKGKTKKEINQELINDFKAEANYIRKLYDDYMKLVPLLGEEGAAKKMSEILDGGDYSKESLEQGILDITDALKKLGDEGEDAAREILRSWGLDEFSRVLKQLQNEKKAAEDAQKALDKYLDALEDWAGKNQELSGTGVTFNVSKAIATYRKALADADKKSKSMLGSLLYGTTNNEERLLGYSNINEQWAKSNANALVTLRNSITNMADDIIKEQLEKGGFDLTNFNDKTLAQLNDLKAAIETIELPDEVKVLLKDYPALLKALEDEIANLKQAKIDKTIDPERWKKIAKQAKYIAERFLSVAESLKAYADATGNTNLSIAADAVGRIAQNLKAAEEGYKAFGGWWGAVIGGGSDLITQVLDGITESEKEAAALRDTLREVATDSAIKQFSESIKKAGESIFGDSALSSMNGAISKLKQYESILANIGGLSNGERRGSVLTAQGTYNGVEFTRKAETLFKLAEHWGLERISAETGKKILNDYGSFNVELLNWIKDAGWDLTDAEKEWLDEAIEASTNYSEAMKTIEDTAKSLLDNTLSDVADKMVDSWWEAGEAALDYADILGDVAKSYAKLIVQDMLMKAAFDDDRQQAFIQALKDGDAGKAMSIVEGAMQAAVDMLPEVNEALQVLEPYRLMASEGGDSNSVGNGFKSITEDQAGLLASYLNAIRADVSVTRGLQEKGWSALSTSIPTLNDYLNQIAGNTFDTAQSTRAILSELQSVIGSPGTSGMVVRVEYA